MTSRTEVMLRLNLFRNSWDGADRLYVYVRPTPEGAQELVATLDVTDFGPSQEWVEIDVTDQLAGTGSQHWECALQFANSPGGKPDDPPSIRELE